MKRIVVVGAGFAGIECVKELADIQNAEIVLIDKRNHHLFQPLLYQVATGTLGAPDIARSLRGLFENQENVQIVYDKVLKVDLEQKNLTCDSGTEFSYDYLVMAPGARTSFFGQDHWKDHTLQLKSLDDAAKVRRSVLQNLELAERTTDAEERKRLMTIAIVGGGPTGVELAGGFADLIYEIMKRNFKNITVEDMRISLIEAAPRLLPPFSESHSAYTKKILEAAGVEVLVNTMVSDITPNKLSFKSGESLEAGTIIWAAGVQANDVMKNMGLETPPNAKVSVEQDMSVADYPEVFIAGDASFYKDAPGGRGIPAVGAAAAQQGKFIGSLLGRLLRDPEAKRPAFKYLDKGSMAIIRKNKAVVDASLQPIGLSGSIPFAGFFGWLTWLLVHVLLLIGFKVKVGVLLQWFSAFATNQPRARAFSGDSDLVNTCTQAEPID